MEVSTNSSEVAMIVVGAIFSFVWFGFHYPSVWVGVIGVLLIAAGTLITIIK